MRLASLLLTAAPLVAHAQPAPTTSEPAPLAEPLPAAPPAPAPAPAPAPPKHLAVGKESPGATFAPSMLMQGWFISDTSVIKGADGEDVTVGTSTFRVRRAEIALSGELLAKGVKYKVMIDPSRVRDTLTTTTAVDAAGKPVTIRTPATAVSVLQDFFLTFVTDYADISLGQLKVPISWEGMNSSAKLLLPERAFVAGTIGDKRDIGVRVDKTFTHWGYVAGVWNGSGQNNFDTNNQKDVALRLEVYLVKGLTLAGMAYESIGYRQRAGTKDRWEADLRYEAGPFVFQSELIRARDRGAAGRVESQGFYAAVAYKLATLGHGRAAGELQPVIRVGAFDPDTSKDVDPSMVASSNFGGNDERIDYEVGLNYALRRNELKLQASYDRQQFDDKPTNNQVIVSAQIWF